MAMFVQYAHLTCMLSHFLRSEGNVELKGNGSLIHTFLIVCLHVFFPSFLVGLVSENWTFKDPPPPS